jgi:lysozyme family protein
MSSLIEAILRFLQDIFKVEAKAPPANPVALKKRTAVLEDSTGKHSTLFNSCRIRQSWESRILASADTVTKHRARYEKVAEQTGVPWFVVGVIHGLESSWSFTKHLHNGDTLQRRTTRVPAGRPKAGTPPFTWEESALDALNMKKSSMPSVWTVEGTLEFLERYNGIGYRSKGINTPYLWSGTFHYSKGKYVRDGVYDRNAVSQQVGAAGTLKVLKLRGLI